MSVPDKSIDPRLLSAAMEEFLEVGYEKASLKNICSKAVSQQVHCISDIREKKICSALL